MPDVARRSADLTPPPAAAAPSPDQPVQPVVRPRLHPANLLHGRSALGTLFALAAFLVSFSPSLLPRGWLFQAAATGLSAACAYALGVLVTFVCRPVIDYLGVRVTIDPRHRRLVQVLATVAVVTLVSVVTWQQRQGRVATAGLVGMAPPTVVDDLLAVSGSLAIALFIVVIVVVVRMALAGSRIVLRLALPAWISRVLALVVVISLILWASNEFLVRRTLESVSGAAETLNETAPDTEPPSSPLRSGGPGSTQPWSELGHNGQKFTAAGPTAVDIKEITGQPAQEPIRVYGSLRPGMSLDEVADTVVRELERTGAFERSTLTVIGTTGRGWIDEYNVASVEYLTGGDCATAAMQYSYLPSPVAFLTSRQAPAEAGRLLFDKVYAVWKARPADDRPRLYVSGESLGAFGGTAAFDDANDMLAHVDGAVWIGTPSFTPLWRSITAARLPGSPQVSPVFDQGRHIRFVTGPGGMDHDAYGREYVAWQRPRVVFLQHASDPIVWWSPGLALRQPDWIREGAGSDVNRSMKWWPLVTFWQVTLDMAVSNDPPAGHGHVYADDVVPVWNAVLHGQPKPQELLDRIAAAVGTP
jgi:uncharacterized membrane protein